MFPLTCIHLSHSLPCPPLPHTEFPHIASDPENMGNTGAGREQDFGPLSAHVSRRRSERPLPDATKATPCGGRLRFRTTPTERISPSDCALTTAHALHEPPEHPPPHVVVLLLLLVLVKIF